ncbi:hypothetical protein GQ53DRAFT_771051 [Thozetella sp. PMI_491]|nr:hypothetical protein GQ53DRAFT_771051 [Thozetella sp. PMI_491]
MEFRATDRAYPGDDHAGNVAALCHACDEGADEKDFGDALLCPPWVGGVQSLCTQRTNNSSQADGIPDQAPNRYPTLGLGHIEASGSIDEGAPEEHVPIQRPADRGREFRNNAPVARAQRTPAEWLLFQYS